MKEMMALAGQFVVVLVRALYSGDFCDWSVYVPLITAAGFILEKAVKYSTIKKTKVSKIKWNSIDTTKVKYL